MTQAKTIDWIAEITRWWRSQHWITRSTLVLTLGLYVWANIQPHPDTLGFRHRPAYGWPFPEHFCWVFHGGQWRPDEGGGVFALFVDVVLMVILLFVQSTMLGSLARHSFRLRLSTAIALSLLGACLLYANMRSTAQETAVSWDISLTVGLDRIPEGDCMGWPLPFLISSAMDDPSEWHWYPRGLLGDVVFASIFLLGIAAGLEQSARQREKL